MDVKLTADASVCAYWKYPILGASFSSRVAEPMSAFPHLFSPITIRQLEVKNRIVFIGHMTYLNEGIPGDRLVAYHGARALGGTGLIITEVAGVHASAYYSPNMIDASDPACVPGYRRVADVVHAEGARIFSQLFHPGREIKMSSDGTTPTAYSASATANERFHLTPRPIPKRVLRDIVHGYGVSASHIQQAGIDGVEILASQGYLPAQFLNPNVNKRDDRYGGSFENRLRFLKEIVASIREQTDDFIVGIRISAHEMEPRGLQPDDMADICHALDQHGGLDYFNVVAGTSATLGGSIHIVPPMMVEHGYVAPFAAKIRDQVGKPVIVTGRINQPQIAERVLSEGQADLCGMTRALICDPEMPNKAHQERLEDIRACIGCNQACIGHSHTGHRISCIQHPETGREVEYGARGRADKRRKILVAGGGPAGMKAAAVAAERGHAVTLYETAPRVGGQALLAQLLPGRAEFGGIVTNLNREMELSGVKVITSTKVTAELVQTEKPDAVIVATGATPRIPEIPGAAEAHVVSAWQVLRNEVNVGQSVVIADWRCDWIGLGLAEKLACEGCRVRLGVNGYMAGQSLQQYVRDHWLGTIHKLGVEVIAMVRLYGADADSVYFQHTANDEPVVCEDVETLVLSLGHDAVDELDEELCELDCELLMIGDCLGPRSAEEAVLEGMKAGLAV